MPTTMRAARLHEFGKPFSIDTIDVPKPGSDEVLVRVKSCGVVPNLKNVLNSALDMPSPNLPAIYGLDAAGVIEATGDRVRDFKPGERVYVNPARFCGSCHPCLTGKTINCQRIILNGYFGITPGSQPLFEDNPWGGYAEFMPAPQSSLVRIPDNVSFSEAARLGYLGTAYRGLKIGHAGPGKTVFIDGITGTLGLGAVALALALGVRQILGTARNDELFDRIRALAEPGRIQILKSGDRSVPEWCQDVTQGRGVDLVLNALNTGAPVSPMQESLKCLNRGGNLVNVGAIMDEVPLDVFWMMSNNISLLGSSCFDTKDGQEMADLAEINQLDFSFFEHRAFSLEDINEAIECDDGGLKGFNNAVICP